jgi:hypothetical protein
MANAAVNLNTVLQTNVPFPVRIKTQGNFYDETDYNTKEPTGGKIRMYIFLDSHGNEYKHYAKPYQEEILGSMQVGDEVTIIRKEELNPQTQKRKVWVEFHAKGDVNVSSPPQLQSNVQAKTQEKHVVQQAHDAKNVVTSQILHGFFRSAISSGQSPRDAYRTALAAYGYHAAAVEYAVANHDTLIAEAKKKLEEPTQAEVDDFADEMNAAAERNARASGDM